MKPVTMYRADDGSLWRTATEAIERDGLNNQIDNVLRHYLGPEARAAGPRWGLHSLERVRECTRYLTELTRMLLPADTFKDTIYPVGVLMYLGHLDDPHLEPLARGWARLGRIDETGQEWEQPFYVMNPDKRPQET